MNTCNFYGRIASDPEMRLSQNGTNICRFNVAINAFGKDKNAIFLGFTAFNKTAELINDYFHKGSRIGITSHADVNQYTDKDGKKHSDVHFIVDQIDFVDSKSDNSSSERNDKEPTPVAKKASAPAPAKASARVPSGNDGFMDLPSDMDDLPFS